MLNISAARKGNKRPLELNIAPLIDMIFILLIFFMVTTSFVRETGVEVHRPVASTAATHEKSGILIGVTKDNRVFIDNREVDIRAVRAHVERALAENPESGVIIVADKESNTGAIIQIMDGCKIAGAESVAVAAHRPNGN